jgi:hypothetical protein
MTPADEATFIQLWQEGASYKAIAHALGPRAGRARCMPRSRPSLALYTKTPGRRADGKWWWRRTHEPRVGALAVVLLALASPALAGPVRCTTYEEKTLGRLQTLCADGSRAVSTWSSTLQRWDTTVTPPPGQTCTGQLNPRTRQWEGRCR